MLRGTIAVVLAAAIATSAFADALARAWQDETKQIAIQVAQNGWQVLTLRSDAPHELEATPDPADRPISAMCRLDHGVGEPWMSRAEANRVIRQQAPMVRQLYESNRRFNLERFEVAEIDGVAVIDVYGGIGTLGGLTRRFYLNRNGEMSLYTLMCSAERGDVARLATAISIAQSLRITERAETP